MSGVRTATCRTGAAAPAASHAAQTAARNERPYGASSSTTASPASPAKSIPDAVTKTRGRTRAPSIAVRSARVVSTRLERIRSFRFRVQRGPPIETPARLTTASAPSTARGDAVPCDLPRAGRGERVTTTTVVPVRLERGDERPAHEPGSSCDDHLHGYSLPVKHPI